MKGHEPCPLTGKFKDKCRTKGVVYQVLVKSGEKVWNYFGQTYRSFHSRWGEHKRDMERKEKKGTGTALSAKVWELKNAGKTVKVEPRIIRRAHPYKTGDSNCDLCLTEKTCIALNHKAPKDVFELPPRCRLLNIRTEIMEGCQHKIKFRLIGRKNTAGSNT